MRERVARELCKGVEHRTARVWRNAFGIGESQNWLFSRAKLHSLMFARKEARAPQPRVQRLIARRVLRHEHDERRQVLVHGAKAVAHPRAHRRATGDLVARAEKSDRGIVVDRLGVHGAHHANIVGDLCGVRKNVAEFNAGATVFFESSERAGDGQNRLISAHSRQSLAGAHAVGQRLTVHLAQLRFRVERLEMRRPARLEEIDDALGLRGKVRCGEPRRRGLCGVGACRDFTKRERANSQRRRAEKVPTRKAHELVVGRKVAWIWHV